MGDGELLLAAIRSHPEEDTPLLAYLDWAKDNPEVVRDLIAGAMAQVAALTKSGVGVDWKKGEPPDERRARFDRDRAALARANQGFAASMAWLATRGRRVSVDPRRNSYGYKHEVENRFGRTGHYVYVANGELIAAAIASGFNCKLETYSINARINISRRPLKPS